MRVEIVTLYWFEKKDYPYITKQIKQKGFKITEFVKQCGISRSIFYDFLTGRYHCPVEIVNKLTEIGIQLPFKEVINKYE